MTPEQTLDWLAQQHWDQCREDRPIQDWIRKMKSELPAQPEHELTNLERHERNVKQLFGKSQPKEPEHSAPHGEPVAWRCRVNGHWSYKPHDVSGLICEPLYTTPPQRKPLTDEQKDAERYRWLRNPTSDVALVLDKRTNWVPPDDAVPGVGGFWEYEYRAGEELDLEIDRAIEAAHGIKE